VTHAADGLDLNGIPPAQALYSVGFVLVLMRLSPRMGWLSRLRPADRLVTVLNSRAVTIYLWHNPAIAVSFLVGDAVWVYRLGGRYDNFGYLAVAIVLLLVPLLLFGWVEDVAARRRPRLLPGGPAAAPAGHRRSSTSRGAAQPVARRPRAPAGPRVPSARFHADPTRDAWLNRDGPPYQ
jgi:hypothetical protein